MNTRKWRLAFAGLLIGSLAITTTDAFIFRRMRARRSSGRGAFSSFRQSCGDGHAIPQAFIIISRSSSSAMSGRNAKWNVEGQWNYSTAFLAEHLAEAMALIREACHGSRCNWLMTMLTMECQSCRT